MGRFSESSFNSNEDALAGLAYLEKVHSGKIVDESIVPSAPNREIIKERKANAISYAQYLEKIAALVRQVNEGKSEDTPEVLKSQAQRALYYNLGKNEGLAMQVDAAVKITKRDGWRGNLPKEKEIKGAIFKLIPDITEVERIFKIIEEQPEY